MKQRSRLQKSELTKAAAALPGGREPQIDGRCFHGKRGRLAVARQPASLPRLRQAGDATHWLLPLEDVPMVHAAAALPGEVFWLCQRRPSEVLGQLEESLRGAWVEGDSVVVNLDGQPRRFALPGSALPGDTLTTLAHIVARLWSGTPVEADPWPPVTSCQPQPALLAA